ncbi:MAG: hypothetical protein B7Z22_10465, partial [Hyphomonas sp. 32-62-5]
MTETALAAEGKKPPRFVRALRALNDRRMAAMLLLSLAAGLPFGAVLGTLNAWLTVEGVTPSTIGTLSLITLGYAFKYLWSPAFQVARHPKPFLGPRRTWLISLQVPIAVLLLILPFSNPASQIGLIAIVALGVALLSATHDTVLDAWRIEVARSEEDRDLMAALYQFGYRASTFVTGFMALLLAEFIGWQMVYGLIALMMVSQGADVGGESAVVPVDGAVTEVFVMETPGHTSFAYLPHTISVRNDESGEVRSATIVSYNPRTQATRPGDQIGA